MLRTRKTNRLYNTFLKENKNRSILDLPKIKEYEHWFIAQNNFPYDKVAQTHNLLIAKKGITERALEEYGEIMLDVEDLYDSILKNFPSTSTVKDVYHEHLMIWKK